MLASEQTEVVTCRLILLRPGSTLVLAERFGDRLCLPRVLVWRRKRIAIQLQNEIERTWHLKAVVLDVFDGDTCATSFAVLEVLSLTAGTSLVACAIQALAGGEIPGAEEAILCGIRDGGSRALGPFGAPGWIEDARCWLEEVTQSRFGSSVEITQLNGSARFALVRFAEPGGRVTWMKAVGEPNLHEFYLTRLLSAVCPEYLPRRLAERESWKAWLMEDAGTTPDPWSSSAAIEATRVMAAVQRRTLTSTEDLLAAGAFDWRLKTITEGLDLLAGKAETWFRRQRREKQAAVDRKHLAILVQILRDACARMEKFSIPDSVIHADMNVGNVLVSRAGCVITDWCEIGIGNPFLALPFLERLASTVDPSALPRLRAVYRNAWLALLPPGWIDRACILAPLLAPLVCLFGRGGWQNADAENPDLDRYRCGLIRRIDRVAHDNAVLEVLYS
jgi:hypothetical protein